MAESDRGAALVGLAYLDALLGRLFEAKMLKGTSANRLLNYPGAFSTASARTDAAYSLGWISVETYRDLVTLRKIRNRFAHAHNALTFSDVDVQTQCASLRLPKEALPDWNFKPRDQFFLATLVLILRLEFVRRNSKAPTTVEDPPVIKGDKT